jgi:hypothetical protein
LCGVKNISESCVIIGKWWWESDHCTGDITGHRYWLPKFWRPPKDVSPSGLNQITFTSNIEIIERFQSTALSMTVDAAWYVPNTVIRRDLHTPSVKEGILMELKGGRCVRVSSPSFVSRLFRQIWEPLRLTTLWASTACYGDSFTFYQKRSHYFGFDSFP